MLWLMRSARCMCLLAMASSLLFASAQTEGYEELELPGQMEGSTLQFKVNVEDARANGQDTLSLILTVPSLGWVSLAFNDNGGLMIGSEAVIGLPDTGEVKKYNLGDKAQSGVIPMPDDKQTLIDVSISQESDTTILAFTKILVEAGEISIDANGENTVLSAYGAINSLGYHAKREPFAVDLAGAGCISGCITSAPTEQADAPTAATPSSGAMVAESTAAGIFVLGAIFTLF